MKEINNVIVLKQAPVISYNKIQEVGAEVKSRIEDLNLENQIVTTDTISAIKTTRADLNKEFKIFEEQRKFIKTSIEEPYKDFENSYKQFIAIHYNEADNLLKTKISDFETTIKKEKENRIREYFQEASQVKGIDFVPFEKMQLNFTLTASDKSLRSNVDAFLENIERDLITIKNIPVNQEFINNALFDYKNTLDVNFAITQAKEREKAHAEAQAKSQAEQVKAPVEEPQQNVLKAPVEEKDTEEVFETILRVKGTLEQLKRLKQFIIDNKIQLL